VTPTPFDDLNQLLVELVVGARLLRRTRQFIDYAADWAAEH
jgi:hypothetical protein